MSMTTFYTSASSELAEVLLLTSSPCDTTSSSSSSSSSMSVSVDDDDMMMLDFDDSCVTDCLACSTAPFGNSLDLIHGDSQTVTSAVFCFVKKFVCASGSSTVAIDNKIEQAMDLVKSHLMFAVREEVEVLKERIDVLMERIAFLESENQILRAAATQETLAQLSQLEATFPISGTDNASSAVAIGSGAIVNNTVTSTTTTTSTTTPSTTSQVPNGTSPAP